MLDAGYLTDSKYVKSYPASGIKYPVLFTKL